MNGFGYCVWYRVNARHPLAAIVQTLSRELGTPVFVPHITLRSKMDFAPEELPYLEDGVKVYRSVKSSTVYMPSWETEFHALEVPVEPVFPLPRDAHVSLAYRLDRPFIPAEERRALALLAEHGVERIARGGLTPQVFDARSKDVTSWKPVEKK